MIYRRMSTRSRRRAMLAAVTTAQTGSENSKTATARCSIAGEKLFGTGFDVVSGNGKVAVNAVRPSVAVGQNSGARMTRNAQDTPNPRGVGCSPPVQSQNDEALPNQKTSS
jgi:hypothetical protein